MFSQEERLYPLRCFFFDDCNKKSKRRSPPFVKGYISGERQPIATDAREKLGLIGRVGFPGERKPLL